MSVFLESKLIERQVEDLKERAAETERELKVHNLYFCKLLKAEICLKSLTFTLSPLQTVSDNLSKKGKELEVSENLLQKISDKVNVENQKRLRMEEDKGQITEVIEQLDSQKARVREELKGPYMQKESAIKCSKMDLSVCECLSICLL